MKRNVSVILYISLAFLSLLLLAGTAAVCYGTLFGGKGGRYVTHTVPLLVGTKYDPAALPDGFYPGVSYAYDDTHPAGTVLSQSPAAHTERTTRKGQPVLLRLVISRGQQTVEMPDLRSTDVRQAKERLRALGFSVGTRATYATHKPGYCVISQSASPGAALSVGSEVILTYAAPQIPQSVRVPDLYGLDRAAANTALLQAGLLPGNILCADCDEAEYACHVTAQAIASGARVPIGTQIDYTLSRTVIPWNFPIAEESSKESADFIK